MALQYLTHDKIDKAAWDKALNESKNPLMYAASAYLDIVSPEWHAIVKEDYRWIFPLPAKKKFLIPYCYTPALVQQLGFFGPEIPLHGEVLSCFEMIKKRFIRINLNMQHLPVIPENDLQILPNLVLSLQPEYERLFHSFSENHRRNIRKAEEQQLGVSDKVNVSELLEMMRRNPFKATKTFVQQAEQLLPALADIRDHRFQVFLRGVYKENTLLCGALFFRFHHRLTWLFSANSDEGKVHHAMFLLGNEVCKEFSGSHLTLDFEGSTDAGTARFYKGYGAVPENYMHWVYR